MSETLDFSEILHQNKDLAPLMELIESIMSFPEENIATMHDSIIGLIDGAFNEQLKNRAIDAMIQGFEEYQYTRSQAKEIIEGNKQVFNEYINSLKASAEKQKILDYVFNLLYNIFDAAVEKYHNNVIDLPIKLENHASVPVYAYNTDAAADLYALEDITLAPHPLSNLINTGVHIALPEGWTGIVVPRSSIGLKTGLRLSNSVGVIDSEYRGAIGVIYDNLSDSEYTIKAGDRIAQFIIMPTYHFRPLVVNELPESNRNEGGFGSTGK